VGGRGKAGGRGGREGEHEQVAGGKRDKPLLLPRLFRQPRARVS
jgi:hypothetical protein